MKIEERFQDEMLRIYREAAKFGYYPTRFRLMVNERGGLAAAKQLLSGDDPSSGFTRLWEEHRLDLSVEAVVLQEPWRSLFTDEELAKARRRLEDLDYYPGERA